MEFIKNLFKEDEAKAIGLCSFRKNPPQETIKNVVPDFRAKNLVFITNTKNNFLLS
jgi:hypothetical protein